MTSMVKIADLPRYPNTYVSRRLTRAIEQDGLIEPILLKGGEVHHMDQERFEAFCRIVDSLGAEGTKTIITVDWDDLNDEEKEEYL